jgi:hypothetical protein
MDLTSIIDAIWDAVVSVAQYIYTNLQMLIDALVPFVKDALSYFFWLLIDTVFYLLNRLLEATYGICGANCYSILPDIIRYLVSDPWIGYLWDLLDVQFGLCVIVSSLSFRFIVRHIPFIGK